MVPQNSRIIHLEKEDGAAVSCGGKVIFKNKGDEDADQGCNSIGIIVSKPWPKSCLEFGDRLKLIVA